MGSRGGPEWVQGGWHPAMGGRVGGKKRCLGLGQWQWRQTSWQAHEFQEMPALGDGLHQRETAVLGLEEEQKFPRIKLSSSCELVFLTFYHL